MIVPTWTYITGAMDASQIGSFDQSHLIVKLTQHNELYNQQKVINSVHYFSAGRESLKGKKNSKAVRSFIIPCEPNYQSNLL